MQGKNRFSCTIMRAAGGEPRTGAEREIVIDHPSGVMDLKVDARFEKGGARIVSCTISRTARKIMDGRVYLPVGVYAAGK